MRFRFRFLLLLIIAAPLQARAGECEDDFAQCQDDCMVQYGGSIREEMKAKFVKCVRKCGRTSTNCRERTTETRVNHLNEGALDKSPGSRDIDEDGLPVLKKRPSEDRPSSGDDLRDDLPRVASKPKTPKSKPRKPPRDEVADDEVIKAERTRLKTDPDREPPPAPKKVEAPPEPTPPVAKRPEPKAEPTPEPAPAPPAVKPKVDEPKPPPKKEDDHDDLRNY